MAPSSSGSWSTRSRRTSFLQYSIWGIPFLLMAGYLRTTLAVEAVLLVPFVITLLDDLAQPRHRADLLAAD